MVKRVPAEVCENCGESYLSDEVTGELLERAEEAITSGAEVEIRRYAASAEVALSSICSHSYH